MKKYTTQELELIDELYDEQMTISGIIDVVNKTIHKGGSIRSINSIRYAINLIYCTKERI